jgi:Flp pilus assembly protein CpaB
MLLFIRLTKRLAVVYAALAVLLAGLALFTATPPPCHSGGMAQSEVLVASTTLRSGQRLTLMDVESKSAPTRFLPVSSIDKSQVERIVGEVILNDVQAGELLLERDFEALQTRSP